MKRRLRMQVPKDVWCYSGVELLYDPVAETISVRFIGAVDRNVCDTDVGVWKWTEFKRKLRIEE